MEKKTDLDNSPSFRLIQLVNLLGRPFYAKYGQQFNIGINEWRIIMTLSAHPGISAAEICGISGLHKMNVSRGVRRLLIQGRLRHLPDPADGRRKILHLTAKGNAVFENVFPNAKIQESKLFAGLTVPERKTFGKLLEKLVAHANSLEDM